MEHISESYSMVAEALFPFPDAQQETAGPVSPSLHTTFLVPSTTRRTRHHPPPTPPPPFHHTLFTPLPTPSTTVYLPDTDSVWGPRPQTGSN